MKPKKYYKAVDYYKLFYRSDGDVDRGRDFSNFILMPEDKRPERVCHYRWFIDRVWYLNENLCDKEVSQVQF